MIEIRLGRPGDAEILPSIELSAGSAFLQLPDLAWIADNDPLSFEHHLELIGEGTTWVATKSDIVIGFLSAERVESSLHILEVSVHSTVQKQGVGRRLVEAAKAWSLEKRLVDVTLTTFRSVAWNEPFYRQCGFRTLSDHELTPRLVELLEEEDEQGLPREKRCAMVWQSDL